MQAQHIEHTDHRPVRRRRGRLGLALAGMLLAAIAGGCGGDSAACHECVILPLVATDAGTLGFPRTGFVGVNPAGGWPFRVVASASDPTPVPGATVSLFSANSLGSHTLFVDQNLTIVAGDGDFWETTTDDKGLIRVYSAYVVSACGQGDTKDIPGSLGVTAAISVDQVSIGFKTTLKCAP